MGSLQSFASNKKEAASEQSMRHLMSVRPTQRGRTCAIIGEGPEDMIIPLKSNNNARVGGLSVDPTTCQDPTHAGEMKQARLTVHVKLHSHSSRNQS